jgi:hypothetical protein
MPKVNIAFAKAKADDVQGKVYLVVGQKAKINLVDQLEPVQWFFNNDPVLDSVVNGFDAEVEAKTVGTVRILIMTDTEQIVKHIDIAVVEEIEDIATALNPKADTPEPK